MEKELEIQAVIGFKGLYQLSFSLYTVHIFFRKRFSGTSSSPRQ